MIVESNTELRLEGVIASPPEVVRSIDEFNPMARARIHVDVPAGGDEGEGGDMPLSFDLVATCDTRLFQMLTAARVGDTVQAAGELRRHPKTKRVELWADMLAVLPEFPAEHTKEAAA